MRCAHGIRCPPASPGPDLGYARLSATKQSLERQPDALAVGIRAERIWDKAMGAAVDRVGLDQLLRYARRVTRSSCTR